jgi:hypothetical protein
MDAVQTQTILKNIATLLSKVAAATADLLDHSPSTQAGDVAERRATASELRSAAGSLQAMLGSLDPNQ